jgi:DNA mismatch endonuclease (patch repair protein)
MLRSGHLVGRSPQMDAPLASDETTHIRMVAQRRRDTDCEMTIRRILHKSGLRYRVDAAVTSNQRFRADLVFTRARVAVFIDGCFWHGCPEHASLPARNRSWWERKMKYNRDRDARATRLHELEGWTVFRYWSHEDPRKVASELICVLSAPSA